MATREEPTVQVGTVAEAAAAEPSKDEKPTGKPTKKKATSKETKPKNPAAPRKRASPSHPPYFEMIQNAITTLKDKTGSSQYAITKFIEEKQKNLPPTFKKMLLVQLRKLVTSGKLVKVKASYKLPPGPSAPAEKKLAPAANPKDTTGKTSKPKKVTVPKTKPATKTKHKPASKAKLGVKSAAAVDPVKPKALKRKEPEKDKSKKPPASKVAKVSASDTPGKKKAAVAGSKKPMAKKAPVKSVKLKSVKSSVKKLAARKGKK